MVAAKRAYHVMDATGLSSNFPQWKGLKSMGVALGYRQLGKPPLLLITSAQQC